MGFRYKVNKRIAVSQPRSDQVCLVCNQKINKVAVIIYLNHPTYVAYGWVHHGCIKKLKKLKLLKEKERGKCGCSYCNKKIKSKIYDWDDFQIHPECIDQLDNNLKKLFTEKGPEMVSKLI